MRRYNALAPRRPARRGIFAARADKLAERMLLVCDTAQTFPSFIYLLPAIMLFGVSPVTVVLAIVIFTTVPLTRYTIEGLRNVPPEMTEAADMSGATRRSSPRAAPSTSPTRSAMPPARTASAARPSRRRPRRPARR